jgi:hypothetical protein
MKNRKFIWARLALGVFFVVSGSVNVTNSIFQFQAGTSTGWTWFWLGLGLFVMIAWLGSVRSAWNELENGRK